VMVRLFGWLPIRGRTNLSGTWFSAWQVESERFPAEVTDEQALIRQFGNRVFVKFRNEQMQFIARGIIDGGRYVTGTWSDRFQGGYHGAFQLIIDPKNRNLSGIWVGYSMTGMVKHGSWVWNRTAPDYKAHPILVDDGSSDHRLVAPESPKLNSGAGKSTKLLN